MSGWIVHELATKDGWIVFGSRDQTDLLAKGHSRSEAWNAALLRAQFLCGLRP